VFEGDRAKAVSFLFNFFQGKEGQKEPFIKNIDILVDTLAQKYKVRSKHSIVLRLVEDQDPIGVLETMMKNNNLKCWTEADFSRGKMEEGCDPLLNYASIDAS